MHAAGAHFVIDSVADLMPVIAQINERLQKQELPAQAASALEAVLI